MQSGPALEAEESFLIIWSPRLCQVCCNTQKHPCLRLTLATCPLVGSERSCKPVTVLGQLPEDVLKAQHHTHTHTHTLVHTHAREGFLLLLGGDQAKSLCSIKASKIPRLSQNFSLEPSHIFCCHPQGPNENPRGKHVSAPSHVISNMSHTAEEQTHFKPFHGAQLPAPQYQINLPSINR